MCKNHLPKNKKGTNLLNKNENGANTVHTHENGKMRPFGTITGMGGVGIKENDESHKFNYDMFDIV
jgi:hypothetical protein